MIHLSDDGLRRLQLKIDALKKERVVLRGQRAEAYEMGGDGWHDNPEFEHIEAEEKRLSMEIARLEREFQTADIMRPADARIIGMGSRVVVSFSDGSKKIFQIGDRYTANPNKGIISLESPLGKALCGAAVGDVRSYAVRGIEIVVIVESIEIVGSDI